MATQVRSHAKINLGLAIGPVRSDGFHGLATLYQTLALYDVVTVSARRSATSRITLTTNHPHVPVDGRNTAWKMVERALARMGLTAEVAVHIQKDLPVQGGMGAGSANAAAALLGLERELGLALPEAERMAVAAEVGSDVPLFLVGGAVLGTSRGEIVRPVQDFAPTACVVAVPGVGVSTPRAFRDWDARGQGQVQGPGPRVQGTEGKAGPGLTSGRERRTMDELSHVYARVFGTEALKGAEILRRPLQPDTSGIVREPGPEKKRGDSLNGLAGNLLSALVRTGIENDFEEVVFPQYPNLREIKHELLGTSAHPNGSAIYAALSGSGSALFGLYRSEAGARAAQRRVQARGCKALVTRTLPREEYWRTMFAE